MKISVNLHEEDLAFLDSYATTHGTSRSSALRQAVTALRRRNLREDYANAINEEIDPAWNNVLADGLSDSA